MQDHFDSVARETGAVTGEARGGHRAIVSAAIEQMIVRIPRTVTRRRRTAVRRAVSFAFLGSPARTRPGITKSETGLPAITAVATFPIAETTYRDTLPGSVRTIPVPGETG